MPDMRILLSLTLLVFLVEIVMPVFVMGNCASEDCSGTLVLNAPQRQSIFLTWIAEEASEGVEERDGEDDFCVIPFQAVRLFTSMIFIDRVEAESFICVFRQHVPLPRLFQVQRKLII